MKDQLYFHERRDDDQNILDHTYCVEFKEEQLYVGYSITHPSDTFCKKTGRENAMKKLLALKNIPHSAFNSIDALGDINVIDGVPHSVSCTLFDMIGRTKEILKLNTIIEVKMFTFQGKRKVPSTITIDVL